MDDRIRVSDADREAITARLRDHFAEGRLTQDELDERVTAALNAKTFGDLRRLMADLPGPAPVAPQSARPQWAGPPPWIARRRGPRLLPVLLLGLAVALLLPSGGWVLFGLLKLILAFWLVAFLATGFFVGRSYRRMRRSGRSGPGRDRWGNWHV